MKLTPRSRSILAQLLFLGLLMGTLFWELFMRLFGLESPLTVGPVGFDLIVIEFWISINPGSFLGIALGFLLFRSV